MWIFNTVKFRIIESYILSLWYIQRSQEWSHVKYVYWTKPLIIPKHKEISRWTLNNIFKIISVHLGKSRKEIEAMFLGFVKNSSMKFTDFLNTLPELEDYAVEIVLDSGNNMIIENIEGKKGSLRLLQWFLGDESQKVESFPLENFCEFYDEWKSDPEWHHTTINMLDRYNKEWWVIQRI